MVGLVLVSHSASLAAGVAELAGQMAGEEVRIEPAGGARDGSLGTDADRVLEAVARADTGDGVVVLCDIGSSVLTVRSLLEDGEAAGAVLADAPLVEGAVAAAVVASAGRVVGEVAAAAEEARGARKL